MKIAITGHTAGIGKAIYELLAPSHEIIGISRSNGYDINDTKSVLAAIKEADVFINNAYSGLAQRDLLVVTHHEWKNTNKLIINIGSMVTDYPRIEKHLDALQWDYRDHKRALRDTFRYLSRTDSQCNLALISPGATDTDMVKHHKITKLDPLVVAKAVEYVMQNQTTRELILYAK